MFRNYIERLDRKLEDWLLSHHLLGLTWIIFAVILIWELLEIIGVAVAWVLLTTEQMANLDIKSIIYFTLIALGVAVASLCALAICGTLSNRAARKRMEKILWEDPLVKLQATLKSLGQDVARAIVLIKASKSTQPDKGLGEVRAILTRTHGIIVTDAVLRDAQLHRAREAFEVETAST